MVTTIIISLIYVNIHLCRKNLIMLQVGYTSLSYEHFKQTSQYDSTALMGMLNDYRSFTDVLLKKIKK